MAKHLNVPVELRQWAEELLEANPGAELIDVKHNSDGSVTFYLEKNGDIDSVTLEPEK